jgi:histidinol-phosphate aminotransferase
MPDRSPLDVIKTEIRSASAYTLKYLEADVKLDQNENPHEIPSFLKKKVAVRFHELAWNRYPEFVPSSITKALSRHTGWTEDGILVGNGSNELILAILVATAGPGRTVALPQPTFTLYQLLASSMGASIRNVPLAPDLSFDVQGLIEAARVSEVLIVCSPNNPTGSLLSAPDLEVILGAARGLVVVDEAYYEFSRQTVAHLLKKFGNLVVLRTFSKAMALAGLRFGYMMASPELAKEINKVKLPYNVNIFTLTAAEILIDEAYAVEGTIRVLIEERETMRDELSSRPGVEAFPSQANFVLFRTPFPAGDVFEELYEDGVLIRNVSHYPMLDRALRVSIGSVDENQAFLNALDRALEVLNERTDS